MSAKIKFDIYLKTRVVSTNTCHLTTFDYYYCNTNTITKNSEYSKPIWSFMRLIPKTSSLSPPDFWPFGQKLIFTSLHDKIKKISTWENFDASALNTGKRYGSFK